MSHANLAVRHLIVMFLRCPDPNVFKSLEKTKLKDLNDSFTNEDKVTMDYILTG